MPGITRICATMVGLAMLSSVAAKAASPIEGVWAAERRFCGADLSRAANNTDFPLIVTEQRIDWALNRCTILRRIGRQGAVQLRTRCETSEGEAKRSDFTLRRRGDRLTVTFADGAVARYVRCPKGSQPQ
jgi:hypothetical protein